MPMSFIEGRAYENQKTKQLTAYIPKKTIAVLHHEDIDGVASEALIHRQVLAVVNFKTSMTGKYVHDGVYKLLRAGIPVFDVKKFYDDKKNINEKIIRIAAEKMYVWEQNCWRLVAEVREYTEEKVLALKNKAYDNFPKQFKDFAENTLFYAKNELPHFYSRNPLLPWVENENVLIVIRGTNFQRDLEASWPLLKKKNVKVIAVDGAADSLLQLNIPIDAVIGDMDSVSEAALLKSKRLYVHTYINGYSPGEERLKKLGIRYEKIPFIGTSEDIAILFSFWSRAKKIFLIGSHSAMNEFLEKGRKGMGSSILVRMLANDKIVDLKGFHLMTKDKKEVLDYRILPIALTLFPLLWNFDKVKMLLILLAESFLR